MEKLNGSKLERRLRSTIAQQNFDFKEENTQKFGKVIIVSNIYLLVQLGLWSKFFLIYILFSKIHMYFVKKKLTYKGKMKIKNKKFLLFPWKRYTEKCHLS